MDRREFLEASGVLAGSAMLGGVPIIQSTPPMIGIQIGAVSFVDEGTDRVLDGLRETAAINTLFVATFTYGRGIAGRQLPNQPLPDHGKQEYDTATFRGGNYATPHPQYYRNTSITPERAPDHPNYDVLADVLPRAHSRGMKVIAWFEDVFAADVPGFEQAREVMVDGQRSTFACTRNPNTRNFWLGLVEDYLRSYDVDGLMWGSERQGPLGSVLGTNHGGTGAGGRAACFCQYCSEAAKAQGINVDRAKQGYNELINWSSLLASRRKPADGAFVTFWRLLVKYPEILAWERLWNEALERHVPRLCTNSPTRSRRPKAWAGTSGTTTRSRRFIAPSRITPTSVSIQTFSRWSCTTCAAASVSRSTCAARNRSLFADLTPEATLALTYDLQQYHDRPLNELAAAGPEPGLREARNYARRRRRLIQRQNLARHRRRHPNRRDEQENTTVGRVRAPCTAAFAGGAHGVMLSRKYSEMRLDNIRGGGRALRELKLM